MISTQTDSQKPCAAPSSPSTEDTSEGKQRASKRPNEKPSATQTQKTILVELAVAIGVEIPAPDGWQDMKQDKLIAYALKQCPQNKEYKDAYWNLHNVVRFHRDTYPDAQAEFTPCIGLIPPQEIE